MSSLKRRLLVVLLAQVVVFLLAYVIIDTYFGWRDMHHINNLQRRVGELEQHR